MFSPTTLSAALAALALSACGASQDTATATTVGTTPAPATEHEPVAQEEPTTPTTTPAEPATAEAQTTRMNDGQIGEVLETVDRAEIKAGELAKERSQNPAVKELADEMVDDHTTSHDDAGAFMLRATIRPEKSDLSRALSDQSNAAIDRLENLSGAEFDKAFVDSQVTMHQEVIETVDRILLPEAVNQDLEATVAELRPVQVAHLQQAIALQAELGPP